DFHQPVAPPASFPTSCHRRTQSLLSLARGEENLSRLSHNRPSQIRRLEIARPFGRSDLTTPRSDLADQSQPSIFNPTAQINPVVCISPCYFAPVRTSRPTRAIDLRSNGPHRPHTSASPIYSRLGPISPDESPPLIPNPVMRVFRKPLRKPI